MVNLDALLDRHQHVDRERIARTHPPRLIRHPDGSPYLTRYYLIGGPTTRHAFDRMGRPKRGVHWAKTDHGLYLHHFHSSDERRMHNHPWDQAASLMLAGGYIEHRPDGSNPVLPGERTHLTRDTYHRVELIDNDAWSLFAVGKYVGAWTYEPVDLSRTW